jgi:multimeric flavodoxin WrbA
MVKNILIITGSPRINGNSDKLASAFTDGARAAGHTITKFPSAYKKVNGCTACDGCWKTEKACCINDDFAELAGLMEKADKIIWAFPLYWGQAPSQLKAAIDRLYAYVSVKKKRSLDGKEYGLLITGECQGLDIFNDVVHSFTLTAGYFNWTNLGTILVPEVFEKNAILSTDALGRARALGQSQS